MCQKILGDDGVFLYPSHPTTAAYHTQSMWRPWNFVYTAILNVIGVPVTQVPLGLDSEGLPLGIQVKILLVTFMLKFQIFFTFRLLQIGTRIICALLLLKNLKKHLEDGSAHPQYLK